MKPPSSSLFNGTRRQSGQALIYGIFTLLGGLAVLLFLFNTSQMTAEKTKLVNTADAAAYSAAVMHARVLNFDAYANRALMANEVIIAQAVSITSWSSHIVTHTENVWQMNCRTYYSRPVAFQLLTYIPACYLLALPQTQASVPQVHDVVAYAAEVTVAASEIAKAALQAAQQNVALSFVPGPTDVVHAVMQEVADANYVNDGSVHVDSLPLTNNFLLFDGKPFITPYSGNDRGRFRDATVEATNRDEFVRQRSWTSKNGDPPCAGKADFRRRGGTELIGFDAWKAMDTASEHEWNWHSHGLLKLPTCEDDETVLGHGTQAAANGSPDDSSATYGGSRADNPGASDSASSQDWKYSGLPTFYDLSDKALNYLSPDATPRLKFSIRLTRAKGQTRTSDGTSAVKPAGRLDRFQDTLKSDVLAAVSTSEVFFERPLPRADGKTELASLFNPYWQVHLIPTSAADLAQAVARGGAQ
jgi:hypothetical protein